MKVSDTLRTVLKMESVWLFCYHSSSQFDEYQCWPCIDHSVPEKWMLCKIRSHHWQLARTPWQFNYSLGNGQHLCTRLTYMHLYTCIRLIMMTFLQYRSEGQHLPNHQKGLKLSTGIANWYHVKTYIFSSMNEYGEEITQSHCHCTFSPVNIMQSLIWYSFLDLSTIMME